MREKIVSLCLRLMMCLMSNWENRDMKLHQRYLTKNFSKPFRKKIEKDRKVQERQKIREAQKFKYDSTEEDDDQVEHE